MIFRFILLLILSFGLISNTNAELEKAIITDVNIVNSNYNHFDFDVIGLDKKVPLKYLISSNVLFEIKGKNFVGNNFKGTLKIKIGETIYENETFYTNNNNNILYFGVKEIRDIALDSIGKTFQFEFCPYSILDGFGECGKSDLFFIKEDRYKYNDTNYNFQYYMKDMNIEKAKDFASKNNTPIIAVIDDGISILHDDLEGKIWVNKGEINGNGIDDDNNGYIDDYYGWNFVDDNNMMFPKGDHGTGVAGIIGANSNNNIGIAGVTNNVKLMPIITCGDEGCSDDNINDSIKYAVKNGADIINLSLGGQWYGYDLDNSEAIEYAVNNGVIIVIAAGNGDSTLTSKGINTTLNKISPVCNENKSSDIIGVSALSIFSDKMKNGMRPYWSNYGDCTDMYAYGEDIVLMTRDGGYNNENDGTSFSSPIIAGIIGLGFNQYGKASNEVVYKALKSSYNQWHGIDAKKYIEELGKEIELVKSFVPEVILSDNDKLILQYKEEFNIKLGDRLDKMPKNVLEILSIKLMTYAEESPIFKKFSVKMKEIVELKIAGLKAAIDDRLK